MFETDLIGDSAKTSSSLINNGNATNGASIGSDTQLCCGDGSLDGADKGMGDTFLVEAERLAAVRSLQMIDRKPESRFDSITFIMKSFFQVPISAITLIEDTTIHYHSRAGEWSNTEPRHGSFCDRILEGAAPRMLVVEDASADIRFSTNRNVTGKPFIRFYAGCPLVGSAGHIYGTLCIIDSKPRRFSAEQYLMLCHFAELATRELERESIMKDDQSELETALLGAKSATGQFLRAMDALNEAVMLTDVSQPNWPVVYCNDAWSKATGSHPDIARASSSSSSNASANSNNRDELNGCPLQPLAPFWQMFKDKAADSSSVATAMAAARLGQAFTLSVHSTTKQGEVISLRFKPVSEPGRLGAAAMPQIAVRAGIGLDWMVQGNIDGNDSIDKIAGAATAAAATIDQQNHDAHAAVLPVPAYYLGVVLNQGPLPPSPRRFPVSPFLNYGETTGIVVSGREGGTPSHGGATGTTAMFASANPTQNNSSNHDYSSTDNDSYPPSPNGVGDRGSAPPSGLSEASKQELQFGAEVATALVSVSSKDLPPQKASATTTGTTTPVTTLTPIQALLGKSQPLLLEAQSSSGAWGLMDRPPPLLSAATLGALIGCGSHSRCYRGVWNQERVAVKVTEMLRESYEPFATIFTLPLADLPTHPNLVGVKASVVVTSPTGVPNRTHLEVWTVDEFCNRGQLGDAIECGRIQGASFTRPSNLPTSNNCGGGSSPRPSPSYDLRAILLTAQDIASAMAVLHSSGTIHGALTSNNVLLTSDLNDEYRGWKAMVGDYALVASEAAISGDTENGASPHEQQQQHPLLKFRGITVRTMNRPSCVGHFPPDVLLGAPISPSTDVYSFGVLCWELLSGKRAWRKLRPAEVVQAVAVQGCRLTTEMKGVPRPVVDVVQRCLAKDAASRPSFNEVVEMLKQLQITMV